MTIVLPSADFVNDPDFIVPEPPSPVPAEAAHPGQSPADSRYPGHWAHRKIAGVYANIASVDGAFNGLRFLSIRPYYNEIEKSNDNKFIRAYSNEPAEIWTWDNVAKAWAPPLSEHHGAIVNVPLHDNWIHAIWVRPWHWPKDGALPAANVWIQCFHRENGQDVWEGGTPPNEGNKIGIDRLVSWPFPGGKLDHHFPGSE